LDEVDILIADAGIADAKMVRDAGVHLVIAD